MRISVACVVTLLVSCSCALNFGGWAPEMPLKGTQDAFVGLSVALSSKYAVVGVPQGRIYGAPDQFAITDPPRQNGRTVVWSRADTQATTWPWSQNKTLIGDAPLDEGDLFGTAVALHEDMALIGSPHAHKHGVTYLFDLLEDKLICKFGPGHLDLTENATSIFGFSVALSQNYIAIGNPTALDKRLRSAVHVYTLDPMSKTNCSFTHFHKIELPEQSFASRSDFGFSIALAERDDVAWLAIGARYYFGRNETSMGSPTATPMGAVFVYTKKYLESEFVLQATLQEVSYPYGDSLGSSLSFNVDGTILAVGAVQDSPHIVEAGVGKVFLYQRTGDTWKQQGSLTDSGGKPHDQFGSSVSFQKYAGSNMLAVGSLQNWRQKHNPSGLNGRGAVFIYSIDINGGPNGAAATDLQWYVESNSGQDNGQFGFSIGFSTTNLIVGAPTAPGRISAGPRNETIIPNCGVVWVYDNNVVSSLPAWTIAVIVISSVSFVIFIGIAIVCLRLRAQRKRMYDTLN